MKKKRPAEPAEEIQPENSDVGFTRVEEDDLESRPTRRRTLRIKDLSSISEEDRAQLVQMVMEDPDTLGQIGEAVDAADSGEGAPAAPGTITPTHIVTQLGMVTFGEKMLVTNAMRKRFKIDPPPEALSCFEFPKAFTDAHAQGLADLENEFIPETWRIYMTGGDKYQSVLALGMTIFAQWKGFGAAMREFAATRAATAPNGKVEETVAPPADTSNVQ